MKIILTVLVVFSLAFAQDLPGWGFYGGIGMNNAKISLSSFPSTKPLTGILVGVSKGVMLGGMPLFVGAGLGQRGYKFDQNGLKAELSMNFFDVWMVIPYPIGPAMVWAGPGFGLFLNGKRKMEMGPFSEEEDLDEGFDEPEFGIILGGSYPLPVMDGKLNLNAGYYLGLIEHDDALTFNSIFAHLSYSL